MAMVIMGHRGRLDRLAQTGAMLKSPEPSRNGKPHAEVGWQDNRGNMGVRSIKVAEPQRRSLQLWLAQQFLVD